MRILSADWVLPVEGDPIPDGAVAIGDDGRIAAVGPSAELGRGERFDGAVILPGFVNAHSHLEYAVYAGFGDGLPFAPWIGLHVRRKARLELADMEAIARVGAADCLRSGITTVGDASFSGAAATACAELGLRAVVYLEVFGGRRVDRRALRADARAPRRDASRPRSGSASRRTRRTRAHRSCTRPAWRSGCRSRRISRRARTKPRTCATAAGRGRSSPSCWSSPSGRAASARSPSGACSTPGVLAAHCVTVDEEEIALLAAHDVAVAHCPRSNGYLGCGVAPLRELRGAGLRVSIATDSPASTPGFDMFEELRAAVAGARARERDAGALLAADALELGTLGGARALGLDDQVGSIVPGKQADLAVVSLEDSPLDPVEDPATAVVLGGSPDRVLATLVGGDERYRKGSTAWRDIRRAGRSARSRMLR